MYQMGVVHLENMSKLYREDIQMFLLNMTFISLHE